MTYWLGELRTAPRVRLLDLMPISRCLVPRLRWVEYWSSDRKVELRWHWGDRLLPSQYTKSNASAKCSQSFRARSVKCFAANYAAQEADHRPRLRRGLVACSHLPDRTWRSGRSVVIS